MKYWVIVGEGGGYEEVKKVNLSAQNTQSSEIQKTTLLMDDIVFTTGDSGETKIFIHGEETTPPDVFMLWGHYNEVFEGISERLTSLGARSINDINAKRIVCSKLATSLLLEKEHIPQAKTMLVTSKTPAKTIINVIGLPAVFKPSNGAQGSGVVLLHTEAEITDYLATLPEGSGQATLAQEYISTSKGKDVRVTMADYHVLRIIQRVADNPEEFRSNFHLGGHLVPFELDEDTIQMCEKTARVCGLRLCGVDLLHTENGYIVGEVNCTPGMTGFTKTEQFKQAINNLILNEG